MQVKQLDHLNMSVADFAESADWYGRVFGMEVVESGYYEGQPWGVLRGGDAMLCIYQHPEFSGRPDDSRDKLHRVSHFALRITDREVWEETVKREKIKVEYGGVVNWPNSEAWYVSDPTGYQIEVALWKDDEVSFAGVSNELTQH